MRGFVFCVAIMLVSGVIAVPLHSQSDQGAVDRFEKRPLEVGDSITRGCVRNNDELTLRLQALGFKPRIDDKDEKNKFVWWPEGSAIKKIYYIKRPCQGMKGVTPPWFSYEVRWIRVEHPTKDPKPK